MLVSASFLSSSRPQYRHTEIGILALKNGMTIECDVSVDDVVVGVRTMLGGLGRTCRIRSSERILYLAVPTTIATLARLG